MDEVERGRAAEILYGITDNTVRIADNAITAARLDTTANNYAAQLTPEVFDNAVEDLRANIQYPAPVLPDFLTPAAWTLGGNTPTRAYRDEPVRETRSRYFAVVEEEHMVFPTVTTITPRRADDGSAGYDLYSKETISIAPNSTHEFWTDVKVFIGDRQEVLKVYIRSSLAINRGLVLPNSVGIIDKSYFGNVKNDGNIAVCIWNTSDEVQHITSGERIAQGIFERFFIVDNDEARMEEEHGYGRVREGGIGSTGTAILAMQDAGANAMRRQFTVTDEMPVGAVDGNTERYIQRARQMGMTGFEEEAIRDYFANDDHLDEDTDEGLGEALLDTQDEYTEYATYQADELTRPARYDQDTGRII